MKLKTNNMILCGIFAVVIAILAQISITIKSVPVTLLTFAVSITGIILEPKKASISTLISALLSIILTFVLAGDSNEIGKLTIQTGGVLVSYALMAYIIGYVSDNYSSYVYILLAMIIGLAIVYLTKTLIFVSINSMGINESFSSYVRPFISSDMMEILVATWIGLAVKDKMNLKLTTN